MTAIRRSTSIGLNVKDYGAIGDAKLTRSGLTTSSSAVVTVNAAQVVTITATAGTFTLTFGANTTSSLAYNITAGNLQTALRALTSIGSGNCTVAGGPGSAGGATPYVVVFTGTLAALAQSLMTIDISSLTGLGSVLSVVDPPFKSTDAGKKIAGAGIPANTTILSYQSAGQVTMSANATATSTLGGNDNLTATRVLWYTQEDTSFINAAKTALTGRGKLLCPGVGYVVEALTVDENIYYEGSGEGATTFYLKPGSTSDAFISQNFAKLTRSGSLKGPKNCGLINLTVDGGKDYASSGGWCFRMFGPNYRLENVTFRFGKAGNWYSEFGLSDDFSESQNGGPEAHLINVKSHNSDGRGIDWWGPHDSSGQNIKSFLNAAEGLYAHQTDAVSSGNGLQIGGWHSWANGSSSKYGVVLEANNAMFPDAQFEAGGSGCLGAIVASGSGAMLSGVAYGPVAVNGATGILIGSGASPLGGITANMTPGEQRIFLRITGIDKNAAGSGTGGTTPGYAFDATNSGGGNFFLIIMDAASGVPYVLPNSGLPTHDRAELLVNGGGQPNLIQYPPSSNINLKGKIEMDNYGGPNTGTTNLDLEGGDTKRQTMQLLNSSTGTTGQQSWYIDWAGSTNADIGAKSLGFRNDQAGAVFYALALLTTGGLLIPNETSIPGTPTAGGVLYVVAGALTYKGSSGTVTTLAVA